MANLNSLLNEHIRRLARRETRATTKALKRSTGNYRRAIAALKRQLAQLLKQVAAIRKRIPSGHEVPSTEEVKGARLRVDGLKAHRARLGLSAKEYGRLLGVSGLTIYNWEARKSKPRRSLLPSIVAVRGMGKKEALRRLGIVPQAATRQTTSQSPPPLPLKRHRRLTRVQRLKQVAKLPPHLAVPEVARRLGLSYNVAHHWLKESGYKMHPGPGHLPDGTPMRAMRKKQIEKLPRGLTIPQAAARLKLSYNVAHKWMREFGY